MNFSDLYEGAKVPDGLNIPDGKYDCLVDDAKFFFQRVDKHGEQKASSVLWKLRVLDGDYAEIVLQKWTNFSLEESERGSLIRGLFKKEMLDLGIVGTTEPAIAAGVESMIGAVLSVQVKTNKNGYKNIYIQSVQTPAPATSPAGESKAAYPNRPAMVADEDIPF